MSVQDHVPLANCWSGTSGLVFAEPNKQSFPAEFRSGSRLAYYAHLIDSLEVNSSFYKIPLAKTFEKWAADTPEHFRFSVKLWRGITHSPRLEWQPADLKKFLDAASALGRKKGCLLIQLPPGCKPENGPGLSRLLKEIQSLNGSADSGPWKLAVEFRHPAWYSTETFAMLAEMQTALVLHDMPASRVDQLPPAGPAHVYCRFHGLAGDYRGGYPFETLRKHASRITKWLSEGKTVFTYFNNTIGDALMNLETLQGLLKKPAFFP